MSVIPNTEVRLLNGVPLNKDYQHTMDFLSTGEQASYFLGRVSHTYTNFTYQRDSGTIRVPESYDNLYNCNYLMYRNNSFGTKWFYAFITHREYINPNMTEIHFEIDVYQTWQFDMVWTPSFVEREHCQRLDGTGWPIAYTLDEGLNYGTEYRVVSAEQYRPCEDVYFLVVCAKQGMHGTLNKSYYGSLNGIPQLLVYYIHPFRLDGSTPGTNLGTISSIADLLGALYTQDNAVNNIVSMYITDCLPNNPSYSNGSLGFDSNNYQNVTLANTLNGANVNTVFVSDMNYGNWIYDAGGKYNNFTPQTESKLNVYPYRVIELADLRGNKVLIKPEYIDSQDLIITISSALGVSNKVSYTVKDYLTGSLADDNVKIKINLENGLINNSSNDVPILTDLLSAYIQGNRNAIKNNVNTLAWQGSMGALGSMIGASNKGGLVGGQMIAEGVANVGNSYLQIQGINAKIKDIANQPPSISNMGDNTFFDYGNGLTGLWIIKKEITPEYQKKLTDFFKMFGYKINELKMPNLRTRSHFNFVKTVGANIFGNIPNEDMETLKSIFNQGVTIWHGDYVGRYDVPNDEV